MPEVLGHILCFYCLMGKTWLGILQAAGRTALLLRGGSLDTYTSQSKKDFKAQQIIEAS